MDIGGIVYIVENAQQFWSGMCKSVCHLLECVLIPMQNSKTSCASQMASH